MKRMALMGIILGLAVLAGANLGCGSRDGKLLAQVGNRKITTADFQQALNNLPENYKVLAESYKGKHKVLDNLVKKELLLMEAESRGYQNDNAVKDKVKELKAKTQEELSRRLDELQARRGSLERQVYENVLLNELNRHLKQEGVTGIEVTPAEVKTYYEDYARKLKILNPAAKVPKLESVQKQIEAILVEEGLIKKLEREHSVEIKETLFREMYGDDVKDLILEENTNR